MASPERSPSTPGPTGFEATWPDVAQKLRAMLGRRGVPEAARDDIVQETATRLWMRWEDPETRRAVWPLAMTIARNLAMDHHRAASRVLVSGDVPDRPTDDAYLERAAFARIDLRRIGSALAILTPRYRQLLLAEVGETPADRAEAAATKMARSRARRRLVTLLQQMPAVVAVASIRRLWPNVRATAARTARTEGAVLQATMGLAMAIAVVVAAPPAGPGTGPGRAPETGTRASDEHLPARAGALRPVGDRSSWRAGVATEAGGGSGETFGGLTSRPEPPAPARVGPVVAAGHVENVGRSGGELGTTVLGEDVAVRYRYRFGGVDCVVSQLSWSECRGSGPPGVRARITVGDESVDVNERW